TIAGPGAYTISVSGNSSVQIFNVTAGNALNISGLSLINGYLISGTGNDGAAIYGNNASVTVNQMIFNGNSAYHGSAIAATSGQLWITNSTFYNNSASYGGTVWSSGTTTIANSTFYNNSAFVYGSAVMAQGGTLTL